MPDEATHDIIMRYYLRKATWEDMELLFQWANDPLVRQNSFSTSTITYEEHQTWFRRILEREDCIQYMYIEEEIPIGQVRITVQDDVAEVGYSVCAEKRSLGHGKAILRLVQEQVWNDFPNVTKIVGRVKIENIASQKAFADAGYEEVYKTYEMKKSDVV